MAIGTPSYCFPLMPEYRHPLLQGRRSQPHARHGDGDARCGRVDLEAMGGLYDLAGLGAFENYLYNIHILNERLSRFIRTAVRDFREGPIRR